MAQTKRVGVVGARGHAGAELVRLLSAHPSLEIAYVGSRSLAGAQVEGTSLLYESIDAGAAAKRPCDAVVLALPNQLSPDFVAAIHAAQPGTVLIDLSADHRFDDDWAYGLPEHKRASLLGAKCVANPGCYATCAQLALEPLVGQLSAPPSIFAVSGYSGAGTTPSPRNDPEQLRDNLMPYSLTGHIHEREIARHLGRVVHFMPHVAPFFRGIALTIDVMLTEAMTAADLLQLYERRYQGEPLVTIQPEAPLVRDAVGQHGATIGGFVVADRRAVVVATIDNLLKGAATQALQNLNITLGFDEHAGIA